MEMKRIINLLSLLFLLSSPTACTPSTFAAYPDTPSPPKIDTPIIESPAPEYVAQIRNAQYQLGLTDALRVVQLTDGTFEQGIVGGADYVSVNVTDFAARGDLNGDGANEVVALIAENYGGTGVFVFLVVYTDVDGVHVFQTSTIVDDRPQLNALSIEEDEIFLDATTHGFEDPLCCPALKTTRHYRLAETGQLDMTDYTTFTPDGRPRALTIESPANGTETYSSVRVRGSVAIAPFENNLAYRIYDVGGVEIAAGALSVSAPDPGAPGAFDATIRLGNILSGALIKIEVQDINAADGSLFAMDSVELVVK